MTGQGSPGPFAEVNVKINRANAHLKDLDTKIKDWAKPESYEIVGQHYDERTVYQAHIRYLNPPNLAEWAAITGDALTNYRSALDYMVYALAVAETGVDPPPHASELAFPITSSKKLWDRLIKRNRLADLGPAQIAVIEQAQPYLRSDAGGDALTRLRDLNDPDKHRILNISVFGIHSPKDIRLEVEQPFELTIIGEPLYDGAPIAQVIFEKPHPPMKMQMVAAMRVSLADDGPGGPALVRVLADIRDEVLRLYRILKPS